MHRQPFIPARNSRHRIAALSLYRALLRSTRKIDVPQDAQRPARDAMTHAVKKAFVRNRAYTSYRLVYASMAAGYKVTRISNALFSPQDMIQLADKTRKAPIALTHGAKARMPGAHPAHRASSPSRRPYPVTLQAKAHRPTAPHRLPSVSATADGQPFLRLKKPQPKALSRMIGRKGRIFAKKIRKLVEADGELRWDAAQEDRWDELMAKQMQAERVSGESERFCANGSGQKVSESSFAWSVQVTRLWWEWQVERMWRDWNARGEALHQVVEEQRTQLRREDAVNPESLQKGPLKAGNMPSSRNLDTPPNVDVYPARPYPLMASIPAVLAKQMHRQQRGGTGKSVDPFTEPAWNALVRAQSSRLLKWAGKGAASKV
ncbi:hypothetical protein MAC_03369 [Metarhizium acridum CQMa 102]|uniref:Complex 1 LYR protein domain-containing protein n=1 Tax=Metarhizium acridum (strain CQMa 102) TaxID=655827 RepID=E9E0H1_METAQ|nr:uncharacterized protein MAC_03369 [Metarhizium acridum CQMa 102]EFY90591.1 hypothetical protein MAC_03369 [Metarhizium acridum CQMa 102]